MPKFYEQEKPEENDEKKKKELEKSHLFLDERSGPE